eukprot:scaffold10653_cov63-Phaeocystis_antarctica.AAC.4
MKGDGAPPLPEPDYCHDYGSQVAAAWCPAGLAPEEWGQQGGQQGRQQGGQQCGQQGALPWCGPSGGDARMTRLCAMLNVTGDCSRGWGLVASHVRRLHLEPVNRRECTTQLQADPAHTTPCLLSAAGALGALVPGALASSRREQREWGRGRRVPVTRQQEHRGWR